MASGPESGSSSPAVGLAPTPRLVVLDDEPQILRALERSLRPEGFQVWTTTEPTVALSLVEVHLPEAVVSDYRMPQTNGLAFLEEVRLRRPEARRVLLTGQADIQVLCLAINCGSLHRLFLKPWNHEEFVHALREECQQARLVAQADELRRLAERKAHELGLARRLLQVQRLAAVGELAAGLAHELNNPLGTILAFSQILLRDRTLSSEDREALAFIEEGAHRCKRVIDAVVKFALHRNDLPAELLLADVAREIATLMQPEVRRADATLELSIEAQDLAVWGSQPELGQALTALVRNALEALEGPRQEAALEGPPQEVALEGRPRKVTLALAERDGFVRLSVSDTGHGVPHELRDRIFQPFFTTKREGEAAGLGLTLADRIAQSHGGQLQVDSEPGAGATFTLVLPRYLPKGDGA